LGFVLFLAPEYGSSRAMFFVSKGLRGPIGIRGFIPSAQKSAEAGAEDGAPRRAMLLKRKAEATYGNDSK
jgi:hypothetical protein